MKKYISINSFFIIGLLLFCVSKTSGQNTILSLKKAIESAQKKRKSLASLQIESDINQLKTKELNAKYLPRVTLDYTYQYSPILASSIVPGGTFNSNETTDTKMAVKLGTNYSQRAGVLIQQPLFDSSISKWIATAKLNEKLASLSQQEAAIELTYEVTKVYFNILITEDQIKEAVGDTTRTALSLKTTSEKYNNQRALKIAVNEAKITHNNAVQKHFNALDDALVLKEYLLYLTGNDLNLANSIVLEKQFVNEGITNLDENLIQSLPQIQILVTQNQVLQNNEKLERAKQSPLLNLNGYLGADQFADQLSPFKQGSWYGNSYVGLALKLPVLFGENTAKRIRQLKLQQEQNKNQIIEDVNKTKYKAQEAAIAYGTILQQLKTVSENRTLTAEIVSVHQERYKENQIAFNELNDKEIGLQNIELEYNELQKKMILSWLDWKKAAGKLTLQ